MRTTDAIEFFAGKLPKRQQRSKLGEVAGVTRQTVQLWVNQGFIPVKKAHQLALRSGGKCPVDPKVYEPGWRPENVDRKT